jgi:hypothetical protein
VQPREWNHLLHGRLVERSIGYSLLFAVNGSEYWSLHYGRRSI